jgi:predicted Zn-dependent protease
LVRDWKGRARLQYLAKSSVRMVLDDRSRGAVVTSQTWAFLGNVATPSGRIVPVGQSGRGSGLPELEREIATGDFARMLDRIDRSEPLGGSSSPAVLAPPAAAVLIHEAIGHFAEAAPDGRVRLDHRLGFRIATEIFNLRDDPTVEGGAAHYVVDDDGVASRGATEVVRDGRMLRFLHCATSARAMEAEPTGNARAASVWDPPLPRMSNLLCDPGQASEEEMLDRMGDGLYIHSLAYGYGFGFRLEAQVRLAEEVRAGRRTGRYLSGGVVNEDRVVLTRAAELGDAAAFNRNAMCGKEGQILYDVGTRAPAIRLTTLRCSP